MKLNSANINVMVKACRKASKSLIRDFGEIEKLQVSLKGPGDFVTNADKKVEKILIEELQKARPDYSILSEEIGEINNDSPNRWVIDPIDGTANFLHGIPHFAISIALRNKNEIISGLIYDPIKNEMFYAEKNNGAFLNNQRIRVSNKKNLNECLFASGGKKEIKSKLNIRKSGSAALDLAYVASGRFDGYFQNELNLWDIAAGLILVTEAGGKTNNLEHANINNLRVNAASNAIYEKMLENLDKF